LDFHLPFVRFFLTLEETKEKRMEARKVAAQFAAYVWYENTQEANPSEEDKARFVKEHWSSFLPVAPEGFGRLLLKIATGRRRKVRVRQQLCRPELAAVAQ
jgi:hypothetical protein